MVVCTCVQEMCDLQFGQFPFFLLSFPPKLLSGGVRIKSLGSGHTGLKIVVSDLSSLRKRMKESLDAHTVGECGLGMDVGWGREWRVCIPHCVEDGCGVRVWETQVCVHWVLQSCSHILLYQFSMHYLHKHWACMVCAVTRTIGSRQWCAMQARRRCL